MKVDRFMVNSMLMNRWILLLMLWSPLCMWAQEEIDEACKEPDKKTTKILSKLSEASNVQEKVDVFNKAIERSPENALVYFQYGKYAFDQGMGYYENEPNPKKGDRSMETVVEQMKKAIELCPEVHAEAYYCAGVGLYYLAKTEEAMDYFRKFLDYENDDNNRYPNDYLKMVSDVKGVIKNYEEEKAFYADSVPFEPFMVPNVSSRNDEYFPMISPDNELMFFTRKVNRANLGDIVSDIREEFTFAERPNLESKFNSGTPFDPPFNDGSFKSYGAATMSVDNKEIILCACKDIDIAGQTYLNCDLYRAEYFRTGAGGNDYQWSELENLGGNINTADGWEGQPSLSADGNTLYFTAMRASTQDNDIYYSKRQADGSWGPAVPFVEVNTPFKDKSPFIHQDDETFYFVSTSTDARRGAGGLDIFYVRREGDSWSEPKNIGVPINTDADELGIFVSAEGSLAYFSSRQEGDWNIFGFELYVEARPESVVIVKGNLEDEYGEGVEGASVDVTYGEDGKKQSFRVNGNDGRFAAVVKTGKKQDVMLSVKQEGKAPEAKLISKETLATVGKETASLEAGAMKVEALEEGKTYELEDILYATSSAIASKSSALILSSFADFMLENPTVKVKIVGHTDDVGDEEDNRLLSEKRANNVMKALIERGVPATRLQAEGLGESQPRASNDTPEGRALNRRTEFKVLSF